MKTLQSRDNLVWIDLEMTGLDPDKEKIIEIATLITDSDSVSYTHLTLPTIYSV